MFPYKQSQNFSKQNAINTHPWVEMVSSKLTVYRFFILSYAGPTKQRRIIQRLRLKVELAKAEEELLATGELP